MADNEDILLAELLRKLHSGDIAICDDCLLQGALAYVNSLIRVSKQYAVSYRELRH